MGMAMAQPQHDHQAFEALMRRHNGRLFRVARAILKDDADAEDALQDAYLDAYRHIGEFRGDAQVSTWLTRIVVNQALMRLRRRKRDGVVVPFRRNTGDDGRPEVDVRRRHDRVPVRRRRCAARCAACSSAGSTNCRSAFRTVFVMREVEEMSVRGNGRRLGDPRGHGAHAAVPRPGAAARVAGARHRHGAPATSSASPARAAIGSSPPCSRSLIAALMPGTSAPLRGIQSDASRSHAFNGECTMRLSAIVTRRSLLALAPPLLRPGHQRRADRVDRRHRQPGRHRRRQARRVRRRSNAEVKKFAQQMVTDHTGVNKQAVDAGDKLKVTPEDNADQPEPEGRRRQERREL